MIKPRDNGRWPKGRRRAMKQLQWGPLALHMEEMRKARRAARRREQGLGPDPPQSIWRQAPVFPMKHGGWCCRCWIGFDLFRLATPTQRDYQFSLRGKLAVVRLQRVQFVGSARFLAERFGLSKSHIHRTMVSLTRQGVIAKVQNPHYLILPDTKYPLPSVWAVRGYDELDRQALSDRAGSNGHARLIRKSGAEFDLGAALQEDW
jgi:hypothetical protein